jgi:hypothetical protein
MVETALAHGRYFRSRSTGCDLYMHPLKELGTVYGLADKLDLPEFNRVLSLPACKPLGYEEGNNKVLAYILVENSRNDLLPFLLPCMGTTTKWGKSIKSFEHFLSGAQKEYDALLTDDQKTLNRICFEMFQLAEELPGLLKQEGDNKELVALFGLWQKALPLLKRQGFVYHYMYYWKTELRGRPEKEKLYRISMPDERPQIYFELVEHKAFYRLHIRMAIGRKPVKEFNARTPFFILSDARVYLLNGLQDAAVGLSRCLRNILMRLSGSFLDH